MRIIVDTREPWRTPGPDICWKDFSLNVAHGTPETGDIGLGVLPEGAVVDRKTPADLASCIRSGCERFERELARARIAFSGRPVRRCRTKSGYEQIHIQRHLERGEGKAEAKIRGAHRR
jgi:hypothetical protein